MSKLIDGAVKGGLAATPISLGYSMADNPSGGLLAMGIGLGVGAAVHLINKHSAVSEKQFGPKKYSDADMAKITKWHNEIGK